jgi:hypothetical protein
LHAENLESCPGDGEDFLFEPIINIFNFVLTDSSKDVNTTTGLSNANSTETTENPVDSKYIVQHFKYYRVSEPLHRDAFCQFTFRWIHYYDSNKSTGLETGKSHLCALYDRSRIFDIRPKSKFSF